jgi:hypothetical protein
MNDTQNITRDPLGKMEASFLAKAGVHPTLLFGLCASDTGIKETGSDAPVP